MKEINLVQITFGSFIKLFCVFFLSIGVFMGILAFMISLFGGDVVANVGATQLTGIKAGVTNLFLFPIIFTVAGFVFNLCSFLPFKYFLKIIKGLKLKMKFDS